MRVAVIGAGPSGLVTLKYLVTAHQFLDAKPIEAVLFEAEESIGGTFAHRAYEDAEVSREYPGVLEILLTMFRAAGVVQATDNLLRLSSQS